MLDLLMNHPLIETLDPSHIEKLLATQAFTLHHYKANNILHYDGDVCSSLEIILQGQATIEKADASGDSLTITECLEGDIFGGHLMFSSDPRYLMTIRIVSDTILLKIKKNILLDLLQTNQTFLIAYLEYIAELTSILGKKIKYLTTSSIRESLLEYLKQQVHTQQSRLITLPLTKKELAENMGIQRTSLSRELKKMKEDSLIDFTNKTITVFDKSYK